jgi:Protein of unknown function (DUF3551)
MRLFLFAFVIFVVAAATGDGALAQNYPWCAYYGSGGTNCGFVAFEQCLATVSGIGGFCDRNTQYVPGAAGDSIRGVASANARAHFVCVLKTRRAITRGINLVRPNHYRRDCRTMAKSPPRGSLPQRSEQQQPRHRNVYDCGGEYEFVIGRHWTAPEATPFPETTRLP